MKRSYSYIGWVHKGSGKHREGLEDLVWQKAFQEKKDDKYIFAKNSKMQAFTTSVSGHVGKLLHVSGIHSNWRKGASQRMS